MYVFSPHRQHMANWFPFVVLSATRVDTYLPQKKKTEMDLMNMRFVKSTCSPGRCELAVRFSLIKLSQENSSTFL